MSQSSRLSLPYLAAAQAQKGTASGNFGALSRTPNDTKLSRWRSTLSAPKDPVGLAVLG